MCDMLGGLPCNCAARRPSPLGHAREPACPAARASPCRAAPRRSCSCRCYSSGSTPPRTRLPAAGAALVAAASRARLQPLQLRRAVFPLVPRAQPPAFLSPRLPSFTLLPWPGNPCGLWRRMRGIKFVLAGARHQYFVPPHVRLEERHLVGASARTTRTRWGAFRP